MKIFIIGFMGCGKTTVGKKLAARLSLDFIDLDHIIEESEQMSIVDIFNKKGEVEFRNRETKYLSEIVERDNFLISLGGGTPCFNNNINLIKAGGVSVYLKMDSEDLYGRLKQSKSKRPLIAGKSEAELKKYIEITLREREPYYSLADLIVEGKDLDAEKYQDLVFEIKTLALKEN